MQTHLHVWRSFQKHNIWHFVMKLGLAAVLGLFAIVITMGVNTGEAFAHVLSAHCPRGNRVYVVARGDTLSGIAFQYRIGWSKLVVPNRISEPDMIYSGQVICIPRADLARHTGRRDIFPIYAGLSAARRSAQIGYRNVFPYPNCTWWANQRYHQLHGYFVPWRIHATAWQWTARAHQFRWHVSTRPIIGSIVDMQPWVQGAYGSGHVAVVERVLHGRTVVASSMNWGANPYAVVYTQVRLGPGITFISG